MRFNEEDLAGMLANGATVDERHSITERTPLSVELEKIERDLDKEQLENEFARQLDSENLQYIRQYRLRRRESNRAYVYDFFVSNGVDVLVEIQGGIYQKPATGHRSIRGVIRDMDKAWQAQLSGYLILQLEPEEIKSGRGLQKLIALLEANL